MTRKSHEHNTDHLRLGDFTVRFRFDRTGRELADNTITANKKLGAETFAQEI